MDKLQKALTTSIAQQENVVFVEALRRLGFTFDSWETLTDFVSENGQAVKCGDVTIYKIDGKPFLKRTVVPVELQKIQTLETTVSLSTRVTYEFIK